MAKPPTHTFRQQMYRIIFEADTPAGKLFDVLLLIAILFSVMVVLLESVKQFRQQFAAFFLVAEWTFTILFSIEYILRVYSTRQPKRYILSFYGIVDLLSILPTYISLVLGGMQYLLAVRVLRLLRAARIFKLSRLLVEGEVIGSALRASVSKILVFVFGILTIVVIVGAVMYLIEGPENGYTSIPISMYWAIVTLTTVGYGDISPQTPLGQFLASMLMIMGYGIIAVPTGIVTVEMGKAGQKLAEKGLFACNRCGKVPLEPEARYCSRCGNAMLPEEIK